MKKVLRIAALALVLVCVLGVFASCQKNVLKKQLIGTWISDDEKVGTIVFSADGKCKITVMGTEKTGTWKASDKEKKVTILLDKITMDYTVKLHDGILTLTNSGGTVKNLYLNGVKPVMPDNPSESQAPVEEIPVEE